MLEGSCLCGRIRWEVEGPLDWMGHCHCSVCRRVGGGPFSTFGGVEEGRARFVAGEELVARFHSSEQGFRPYCPLCGSGVLSPPLGGTVFMPMGCVEGDPGAAATVQFYCGSKAPWAFLPDDGSERLESVPEDMPVPVMPERPELPPRRYPSGVRGSCQCGDVAFEAARVRALVYCHCQRCRKGRSAVCAANFFCDAGGFVYTRGEDRIDRFKVPEADRFTVGFCRGCSSSVPLVSPGATLVVVPGGALDDDPGELPACHIFTGSKSSWFEIPGDLPLFDEYPEGCGSSQEWVEKVAP